MLLVSFVIIVVIIWFVIPKIWSLLYDTNHPLVVKAKGYPYIGNFFDFVLEKTYLSLLTYPKIYGPFVEFYIFTIHAILITDLEIAKEIYLRRPKKFDRPSVLDYGNHRLQLETGLINANGNVWSRIRKATSPSFSTLNIAGKLQKVGIELFAWMDRIKQEYESQITSKKTSHNPVFDMKYESFTLTIRIITLIAFGLEMDNPLNNYFFAKDFKTDIEKIFKFLRETTMFGLPTFLWKYSSKYQYEVAAVVCNDKFTENCQAMIDYKRNRLKANKNENSTSSSMIDTLLINHDRSEKGLSDEEIIANVKVFYLAGTDTTAVTITWVVYFFCLFPDILQRVRNEARKKIFHVEKPRDITRDRINQSLSLDLVKEMSFTLAVIKETLRLKAPVPSIALEPAKDEGDITLSNGIIIPKGVIAWINQDGIHRLPEIFDRPDDFLPDRWLSSDEKLLMKMEGALLAFGGGPRICPGMNLAYNEAVLAVAFLAFHFDMALDCPVEEITRIPNFVATANKMPVAFTPIA